MFSPELQRMRGSLFVNREDQLSFMYSADLPFMPQWASIDVERGEIYIGTGEDDDSQGVGVKLEKIEQKIYERVLKEKKILLVHFQNGDIRQPDMAIWVPLMVAHQHSSV